MTFSGFFNSPKRFDPFTPKKGNSFISPFVKGGLRGG